MSTFHDFLVWFDGWSENIEKQPNEKQWKRLCAKVAEMRAVEPVPAAVPSVPPHGWPAVPAQSTQPAAPKQPSNEREWMSQFKAHLVEESGMDPESAGDVWASYKERHETINLSLNPRIEAASATTGMMN